MIYHNCFIKLLPLVISIYDARSHIHEIIGVYVEMMQHTNNLNSYLRCEKAGNHLTNVIECCAFFWLKNARGGQLDQ